MALLKPLALLSFLLTCRAFQATRNSWLIVAAAAATVILATLAKPNFTICLLPALALAGVYRFCRRHPTDWRLLLVGVGLPAMLVLGGQYYITYTQHAVVSQNQIAFMPLGVMSHYSRNLAAKFILSMLFPALVSVAYFRAGRTDKRLLFAWLLFLLGAVYTYFLAEVHPERSRSRFTAGNFLWSGQIGLFLLFVCATAFFLRQVRGGAGAPREVRAIVCVLAFGAHVVSGMYYYLHPFWW
jgi:hypothetical protein